MIDKSPKTTMYRATKNLVSRGMLQHNVETPVGLVDAIIDSVADSLTEDAQILVLFNIEFVISLKEDFPFTRENITLFTDGDDQLKRIALKMNINTIESLDTDMKFDLTLGNPPYSQDQGNKLLYPDFFELSLEKSDQVVMVMPLALTTRSTKLVAHNENVMRHQSFISDDVSSHFDGINVGRISYVIASKSVKNEFIPIKDRSPYDAVGVMFPERNRMRSLKGVGGSVMFGVYPTAKTVDVIQKVHKGNTLVTIPTRVSEISNWKAKSSSPWVVLLNHTPSKGKFNYAVVKNDGTSAFGNWVHVIEVPTKKAGNTLGKFLQTEEVCNKVMELLAANNGTHTASSALVAQLPWFE